MNQLNSDGTFNNSAQFCDSVSLTLNIAILINIKLFPESTDTLQSTQEVTAALLSEGQTEYCICDGTILI